MLAVIETDKLACPCLRILHGSHHDHRLELRPPCLKDQGRQIGKLNITCSLGIKMKILRTSYIAYSDLNRVVSGFNVIPAPHGAGGKSSTRERRATWGTKDDRRQCHDLTWSISRWCRRWAWTRIYEVLKRQSGGLSVHCLVIKTAGIYGNSI